MNLTPSHTTSQCAAILAHLQAGHSLTPMGARKLCGCDRLGARIYDLTQRGHHIDRRLVKLASGKRVMRYSLATPAAETKTHA